ncbi:MAG: GNAT family N-acetyltransferase [Chloroflexi bacterium]|nr:GNAT family N-acetyltransferase [Chloroflexota bacterium]
MPDDRFQFEQLDERRNRTGFSCGVGALDRYFHRQAGQDQRRRVAAPYVLVDTSTNDIVGYYTLSTLSIVPASLHPEVARKLPRYQAFPGILLGRVAVDQRYHGQGFGRLLLMDALRRCLMISQQVGAMAVIVDAKDDAARSFYEHYGFVRFSDHEYRLYLPMSTIAQLDL